MRQIPGNQLWIGHAGDLRDLRSVLSAGILAVVDLALNEPPATITRELVYCRFPLHDGSGNPRWILQSAVEAVAGFLRTNVPVLVSCGAGMSRSPSIAAAAISVARGVPLTDAVALVARSGPLDMSPALLSELQSLRG
jgi:protein-tyrosine phosphatase